MRRIVAVALLVVLFTLVFQGAKTSALPVVSVVLPLVARAPAVRHRRRPRR